MLSSVAHEWGQKWLDLDDLHFAHRKYHDMGAYAQSKLANLLFVKELSGRYAHNGAGWCEAQHVIACEWLQVAGKQRHRAGCASR